MGKIKVKITKDMGRGLFATKDLRKGEKVEVSPCITYSREDDQHVQNSKFRFYVFSDDLGGSVLALGLGSLFNHGGVDSNTTYKYDPEGEIMVFKANRFIKKGEQLFINYGYDPVGKSQEWESRVRAKREYEMDEQKAKILEYCKADAILTNDVQSTLERIAKPSLWQRFVNFFKSFRKRKIFASPALGAEYGSYK